jgi:hypothetical protein
MANPGAAVSTARTFVYRERVTEVAMPGQGRQYLRRAANLGRHPSLEGISIVAVTRVVDPEHPEGVETRPLITHQFVRHPGFSGETTIVTDGPNALSPAPPKLWEIGPVVVDTPTRRIPLR